MWGNRRRPRVSPRRRLPNARNRSPHHSSARDDASQWPKRHIPIDDSSQNGSVAEPPAYPDMLALHIPRAGFIALDTREATLRIRRTRRWTCRWGWRRSPGCRRQRIRCHSRGSRLCWLRGCAGASCAQYAPKLVGASGTKPHRCRSAPGPTVEHLPGHHVPAHHVVASASGPPANTVAAQKCSSHCEAAGGRSWPTNRRSPSSPTIHTCCAS